MVIGRGLFFSLFGEIYMRQGGDLQLISKISCEDEEFSLYGPRKSDEGADTDEI